MNMTEIGEDLYDLIQLTIGCIIVLKMFLTHWASYSIHLGTKNEVKSIKHKPFHVDIKSLYNCMIINKLQ